MSRDAADAVVDALPALPLEEIAADLAHELNNPLTFVLGNLQTLRVYGERLCEVLEIYENLEREVAAIGLCPETRERIAEIKRRTRCEHVVDDFGPLADQSVEGTFLMREIIRALRGLGSGNDADPSECIRQALLISRPQWKRVAEIREDFDRLPMLTCSESELIRVIANLVANAGQAMTGAQARGAITVRARREDARVVFEIEDQGPGIPGDLLHRVREPYFTTRAEEGGAGLGLKLVDDIVSLHGGRLQFERAPSGNQIVRFDFPIRVEKDKQEDV